MDNLFKHVNRLTNFFLVCVNYSIQFISIAVFVKRDPPGYIGHVSFYWELYLLDTTEKLWDAICFGSLWVKLGLVQSLILCPVGPVDPVEKNSIELQHVNEAVMNYIFCCIRYRQVILLRFPLFFIIRP